MADGGIWESVEVSPGWRSALVVILWSVGAAVCAWRLPTHLVGLAVIGLTYLSLGAFLVLRRPGRRFGWLMFGYGVGSAMTFFTPGDYFWMIAGPWVFAGGAALLLFFPDGRLPSPRWKWVLWVSAALWIAAGFADRFVFFAAGASALVATGPLWRYRIASGVTHTQLKWLAWVVGVGVIGLLAILASGLLVGWGSPPALAAMAVTILAASVGVPMAMVLAVLRYRLYEIDRIVSRTVSYALLAGLLGLFFFGLVAGLGSLIGESPLVVAGSTLAVAALFNPVRRGLQTAVDRRFNRSRYEAQTVMDDFTSSLRDEVDLVGVVEGWMGVVAGTMQPSTVSVWIRGRG